jgi:hypothetical protein
MHRGGTWHDGNQQPLLLHGPPEERLVAEGVGKTIGVRETSGPQLSPGQWQTKTATVAANKAQVTTTTAGHHDMTCLQSTFGSTDAWCQPLWWPMRRHHIPRAGFWWWVVVLLAFAAGPVAICLFFTVGSRGNYSLAERLVDAGYLVWLLLIGIVFSDTLKALHPLHGCAAKLHGSMQRFGAAPVKCGPLVIYCRLIMCVLRVSLVLYGIGWGIGHYIICTDGTVTTYLMNHVIGYVLFGLLGMPFVGTWVSCICLCVDLSSASIRHIIHTRMRKFTDLSSADFDDVDDDTWKREVTLPIRALLREQLPEVSRFGFSIGCFCVVALAAALMTIPDTVNAFTGRSRSQAQASLLAFGITMYLFVPILILLIPVQISTLAGKTLVAAVHEMRPDGAAMGYDRVSALSDYLRGSNFGQGPGFVVFNLVVTMSQLSTIAASLTAVYPVALFMIDEFS